MKPFTKVFEYLLLLLTAGAAVYATKRIKAGTKEVRQLVDASERLRAQADETASLLSAAADDAIERMRASINEEIINTFGQATHDAIARSRPAVSAPGQDGARSPAATAQPSMPTNTPDREAHRLWWQPIVDTKLPGSAQPPRLYWRNNIRARVGVALGGGRDRTPLRGCARRLERGRSRHLRHSAGTAAERQGSSQARRALHAARLCRAAGRGDRPFGSIRSTLHANHGLRYIRCNVVIGSGSMRCSSLPYLLSTLVLTCSSSLACQLPDGTSFASIGFPPSPPNTTCVQSDTIRVARTTNSAKQHWPGCSTDQSAASAKIHNEFMSIWKPAIVAAGTSYGPLGTLIAKGLADGVYENSRPGGLSMCKSICLVLPAGKNAAKIFGAAKLNGRWGNCEPDPHSKAECGVGYSGMTFPEQNGRLICGTAANWSAHGEVDFILFAWFPN